MDTDCPAWETKQARRKMHMTNLLYSLMLFNERQEGFFIGLFESTEKARQVAEHYLSALSGFRDYPCTYEITEKLVVGTIGQSQKVYMIWGRDRDRHLEQRLLCRRAERPTGSGRSKTKYEQAGVELGYIPHWSMPLDRGLCTCRFFKMRAIKENCMP